MNIKLCEKCPRRLFFTNNNEQCVFGQREKFYCYEKVDELEFEYGFMDISTYEFKAGKWKRIKWRLLQSIPLKWLVPPRTVTKWINGLFLRYNIDNLFYDGQYGLGKRCVYYTEHQIYDLNKGA